MINCQNCDMWTPEDKYPWKCSVFTATIKEPECIQKHICAILNGIGEKLTKPVMNKNYLQKVERILDETIKEIEEEDKWKGDEND